MPCTPACTTSHSIYPPFPRLFLPFLPLFFTSPRSHCTLLFPLHSAHFQSVAYCSFHHAFFLVFRFLLHPLRNHHDAIIVVFPFFLPPASLLCCVCSKGRFDPGRQVCWTEHQHRYVCSHCQPLFYRVLSSFHWSFHYTLSLDLPSFFR